MPIHRGVNYETYITEDDETGVYFAQYSITHHKGNETLDYPAKYVIIDGEDEPLRLETEQEAQDAAQQAAMQAIERSIP